MYKSFLYILITLCIYSTIANAQTNLVPNGSFENYTICPINEGELSKCVGWWRANLASTDYVNACAPNIMGGGVNVPYYFAGYQYAYHGNAYVGVGAYKDDGMFEAEYAQCQLTNLLVCGHEYVLSAYISLGNHSEYVVNNFGMLVSETRPYAPSSYSTFTYRPQLIVNPPVSDTLGWTKIETKFYAKGNEQYLTIGRFDYDGLPQLTIIAGDTTNPFHRGYHYYLIDSVSLTETGDFIACVEQTNSFVFTPNGDGKNDLFLFGGLYPSDKVMIYNRWGTKVYEFANESDGWDGRTTSGEECSSGVYYYIIERQEKENIKGFVQLLR